MLLAAKPVAADVDAEGARILGEAVLGEAAVFVTGDLELQRLSAIGAMPIRSPRGFWEELQSRL